MSPPPLRFSHALRAFCLLAFAFTVAYIFLRDPPEEVMRIFWDKAVHATVYGGMAFLLWVAAQGRWSAAIFLAIVALGAADEIHQSFTPERTADLDDLLADGVGAVAVLLVLSRIRGWFPAAPGKPPEPR